MFALIDSAGIVLAIALMSIVVGCVWGWWDSRRNTSFGRKESYHMSTPNSNRDKDLAENTLCQMFLIGVGLLLLSVPLVGPWWPAITLGGLVAGAHAIARLRGR